MKKTLIITTDFLPQTGGVANYISNLCQNLPLDQFFLLAQDNGGEKPVFNYKVKYLALKKYLKIFPSWLKLFFEAKKIIKTENIKQILACQPLPVGTVALLLKKIYKIPYILSFHGMDIMISQKKLRKKILIKYIAKNADKIICNSEFTKNLALKYLPIRQKTIQVIYPCSNISADLNIDSSDLINKYKLTNKKVVLSVGRLVKRKGFDNAIKALPAILKEFPDLIYVIIGSGAEKSYLQNLIKEKHLEKNVLILENINNVDLAKFYNLCSIFLNPARNIAGDVEGFGLVYLEAAAFGKPAICGNQGGEREAVLHNITGIIIDPENIQQISDSVIKLLKSPELAKELGKNGQERVLNDFQWKKQANILDKFLN